MHLRYGHPGRRAPAHLATGARAALCTLALLSAARALHAEDIAIFAGATDTDDHTSVSYSWQLEYRQRLLSYLDFSLAYLNEGHVPGHHRDGASAQLWAVTPRFGGHFDLALGAGPYFYFDTQAADAGPGFRDYHGVGAIVTGSLSYYFNSSWFARLNLSEVHTPGDEDTRTLLLGVGTSLDPLLQRFGEVGLSAPAGSELGVFAGQTIDNSATSPRSRTFGVEYRFGLTRNIDLSATWLNESDGSAGNHNGLAGQVWLIDPMFARRVTLGLGAGPYFALERREMSDGQSAARVEGLVSLSVSWRFAHHLVARVTWDRGFTNQSEDRDILTAGVSWRFGR
jgi:hypothetical protein